MKTNYWVKRYKFKYFQKQLYRLKGVSNSNYLDIQNYGFLLKSLSSIFLKATQLESGRRVIRHFLRKYIKVFIALSCNKSISEKSTGTRMGKGKGAVKDWISVINPGRVIYFLINLNLFQASFILKKAAKKFCFKTKFIRNSLIKNSYLKKNYFF